MIPPFPQLKNRSLRVILIVLGVIVLTPAVAAMIGVLWVTWLAGTGRWQGDRVEWPEPSEPSWPTPPRWTPNGGQIIFAHRGAIYTVDSNGSALESVHGGGTGNRFRYGAPTLSPDGSKMAYVKHRPQRESRDKLYRLEIATSKLDGSDESILTDMKGNYTDLSWSPDIYHISFAHEGAIRVLSPDGFELRTIGGGENVDRSPNYHGVDYGGTSVSWSPDGTHILFGAVVAKADGSGLLVLPRPDSGAPGAQGQFWDLLPNAYSRTSWSPDGSRIAIHSAHVSAISVLYTVDRNGSDSRVLVVREEDGSLSAAGGRPLQEGQAGRQYVKPAGQGP